ncbi:Uncharacterised protein [Bordetella pertussis]|nr:Uncharacterised protein [Bordetella pertussis]
MAASASGITCTLSVQRGNWPCSMFWNRSRCALSRSRPTSSAASPSV